MIAIIDYGVGNLFSLKCSLNFIGADAVVTSDPDVVRRADKLILPGVGAFGDAIKKLRDSGLDAVLIEEVKRKKPVMGICLGMQLLFEKSYEYGTHKGLGILKGEVVPIASVSPTLKIPEIGWNALIFKKESPLFKYVNNGDCVYFVHSYFVSGCDDSLLATAEYGSELTAAVSLDNIYGCQFHPEKSGAVGLNILRGFVEL